MADREEEDLQMALRMSLQSSPPEAKRSKPREGAEESLEAWNRRQQRELMAAAAEKRIREAAGSKSAKPIFRLLEGESKVVSPSKPALTMAEGTRPAEKKWEQRDLEAGEELPAELVDQLFFMLFGSNVSKDILAQWSNQGIRFSSDPGTCIGLVQHEGGPCGVLAPIQAFVLKYLLFLPQEFGHGSPNSPIQYLGRSRSPQSSSAVTDNFASITEERKSRALVLSMVEILFMCGSTKRAVVATLNVPSHHSEDGFKDGLKHEMVSNALESLSIECASDLQKVLRVNIYTSRTAAFHRLTAELPVLQSRMGAILFLISALLSRGLESIQADRDDPNLPLVTTPFGHASQEIVNLLLCGQAVPNVFDGKMDLGGGMSLKGIPTSVEIGFLTLLESLNLCKVGQYLKCPKWPIWVVGSDSHYSVLFALDTSVQDENELEQQEAKIRKAFDAQDQSGGGGFISVEGFQQVLRDTNINFPPEKLDNLCCTGIIVWSEFWQSLLELDRSQGGMKDSARPMGQKQFDLFHFNGIAKSVSNGNAMAEGASPLQRPRLCKLSVSVPPKWTQEEFLADVVRTAGSDPSGRADGVTEGNQPRVPNQHAPLVDCIRTRWARAFCSWVGDAPSIV